MGTLSFFEYLQLKQIELPELESISALGDFFTWPRDKFVRLADKAQSYIGHFHEYLIRGGFPQTAMMQNIVQAQRLLREDIVDRVLKRDMTALFGVRHVLDLEHTFLYLCLHDGGLLDLPTLCANLEVKRPTAQNFIDLLEAAHLIFRLQPFGYGKDILRARYKIYLADAAIAPAVMLKGKSLLEDPGALGVATETAVFKHLCAYYGRENVPLSYWRGSQEREVDIVAQAGARLTAFEVKYRTQHQGVRELKGLVELCDKKSIAEAYIITKSIHDFSLIDDLKPTPALRIPAAIFCYFLGQLENKTALPA
jgi:predicted AAA+ superfamily ATPase